MLINIIKNTFVVYPNKLIRPQRYYKYFEYANVFKKKCFFYSFFLSNNCGIPHFGIVFLPKTV